VILLVRCGMGWGEAEIQNITHGYDGEAVNEVVSSAEESSLRTGKVCLRLNRYYFTYTVVY